MARWTPFPHDARPYAYDLAALKQHWPRLHAGDAEPLPTDEAVLDAWRLFHAGEFERATEAGLQAHAAGAGAGMTVANKAQAIYATYLEAREKARLALLLEVVARAEMRTRDDSKDANAWYCLAAALGRYGQGISIGQALAEGLGSRVKGALEATIRLAPRHADAHIALGAFHAEVIDKAGSLFARMQGASKEAGLASFRTALKLNPGSAIALVEYARGLVMLEGDRRIREATALYAQAAASEPMDATERLDVEMARAELAD